MTSKLFAFSFAAALSAVAATGSSPATFTKDVLPIFQSKCQECHREGEIAPMSFMTYDQVRPWAKAIKTAVLTKKMPPWFADPHYGKFSNDMSLSQAQIETISNWVDSGAKEGNAKDAPKPREFFTGWIIGKPDQIIAMPKAVDIPESGVIEYTYIVLPTGFTEDKWIQAAETRASGRSAMHHVIAFIRPPGSRWLKDYPVNEPFIPRRDARGQQRTEDSIPTELLVGWAPGLPPTVLNDGQAKLIPAGSDIVLQLHYTPNGKPASDVTKVGLIFAKEPPKERVMTMNAMNVFLKIPPGDPNYESHSKITLNQDVKLVSLMPHMHLRGKDFEYEAVYPTGEKQILLNVPHYDFNWQLSYVLQDPLVMPKGTVIECTAHHDNSANNKYNPDPTKEVRWGDQTWQEMMIGWFDVSFDAKTDPAALRARPQRGAE
jgi:mono/diheme cytochrome c family protein